MGIPRNLLFWHMLSGISASSSFSLELKERVPRWEDLLTPFEMSVERVWRATCF